MNYYLNPKIIVIFVFLALIPSMFFLDCNSMALNNTHSFAGVLRHIASIFVCRTLLTKIILSIFFSALLIIIIINQRRQKKR